MHIGSEVARRFYVVAVDDPVELAERCWDAGFTVRVSEATNTRLTVMVSDPFGQLLLIVPRAIGNAAASTAMGDSR